MIRTKSKPQPSQTPSQSLRRDVLRVVVHNNGTAGESQSTYSGAADCPTAAPSWHRFLANTLVERYRYTSEYRTTVRETLLISYYKYAARPARPCSQQPASSQPASRSGAVHKQYPPPRTALQVPQRTAVACQRGKVPRGQTQ